MSIPLAPSPPDPHASGRTGSSARSIHIASLSRFCIPALMQCSLQLSLSAADPHASGRSPSSVRFARTATLLAITTTDLSSACACLRSSSVPFRAFTPGAFYQWARDFKHSSRPCSQVCFALRCKAALPKAPGVSSLHSTPFVAPPSSHLPGGHITKSPPPRLSSAGVTSAHDFALPHATAFAPLASARASSLRKQKQVAALPSFSIAPFQLKAAFPVRPNPITS